MNQYRVYKLAGYYTVEISESGTWRRTLMDATKDEMESCVKELKHNGFVEYNSSIAAMRKLRIREQNLLSELRTYACRLQETLIETIERIDYDGLQVQNVRGIVQQAGHDIDMCNIRLHDVRQAIKLIEKEINL